MSATVIETTGLTKTFPMPAGPVTALRDVSFSVAPDEYVAVTGPSGCGKSTLLHLLGSVDTATSGTLLFDGRDISALPDAERSRIRLTQIGFVFQRFYLLPMLTAWENVELPQGEAGASKAERRARTAELLDYVGLSQRARHRPSQLSGGEMQRVAIARAIVIRPALLLADEPSGNLDHDTGEQVADLLFDLVGRTGMTMVLVTHNSELALRCSKQLTLSQGLLQ